MEMAKLCDSCLCRLCAEENKNGTFLFSQEGDSENLSLLINKYLPIKVENDHKFPTQICPGCHIQLEATKLFMDLIVQGQSKLRDLYRQQQEQYARQEKQRLQLEKALQTVNPKSTVQTYTIQTDESGVLQSFIQILSDGPLFPPDHQLSLHAAGLEKPKRKRGRPPKQTADLNNSENKTENEKETVQEMTRQDEEEVLDADGRRRRKIRPPIKYEGVVQGDELEKMLQEEGIEEKIIAEKTVLSEEDLIIGRIQSDNGKGSGKPVYASKRYLKNFGFKPAKQKTVYQCNSCKRDFVHFGRYQLHMNMVHKTEVHKERNSVLQHQQEAEITVVAISQDLETNENSRPRPSLEDIDESTSNQSKIEKKFYNCDKCDQIFISTEILEAHKMAHTEETINSENESKQPFSCDMCSKIFNHRTSLLYHKKTKHSTVRKFICSKCPKSFKLQQQLQRHQQVHSEDRPFSCSKCTMSFKTKSNLINHLVVHSGEKKFCCNLCGQRYTHSTSLKLHMRWHEGKKPFQCSICCKSFSQKGNLTEHMRIHTGEKPYCCDQCGKSFTTSSQFHLHLKRHTGEKPFVCNYCSKSFLHKVGYIVHVRRHMNERPFKCTQCKRSFPESWALKRHQRIHTQEKPYTCPICFKTFADSSNRLKHMNRLNHTKTQMNEDPYENMIVTLVKNSPGENKSEDGELIKLVATAEPSEIGDKNENSKLQLTQLIDSQGNPISITTSDGQTIPVVTDDDKNCIKGLLPDGTLIPIDLDKDLTKDDTISNLLNLQIKSELSLNDTELVHSEEEHPLDTNIQNIQFMTGQDGQEMCLVTYGPLDENDTVINQDLQSALFLTPT